MGSIYSEITLKTVQTAVWIIVNHIINDIFKFCSFCWNWKCKFIYASYAKSYKVSALVWFSILKMVHFLNEPFKMRTFVFIRFREEKFKPSYDYVMMQKTKATEIRMNAMIMNNVFHSHCTKLASLNESYQRLEWFWLHWWLR